MEGEKLTVRKLMKFFDLQQVSGDDASLNREITVPDINRPGLELTGFLESTVWQRIIILGDKETKYISTLDEKTAEERFELITNDLTPCIVVTKSKPIPDKLIEVASRKNFPIFSSSNPTNLMVVDMIGFLDENLAHFDNVHGVLMGIYGKGILITGESGVGKSEVALDLISRGHQLVADDRVDCYRVHNQIVGKAPEVLKRFLEIRGVGILDVVQMYGVGSYLDDIQIEYIVHLQPIESDGYIDRLGIEDTRQEIMGVSIPKTTLPVGEGRNIAVLVESAVTKFMLKNIGFDSMKKFNEGLIKQIEQQGE